MINNTQNWIQYVLNGSQTVFTYPFKIISSEQLIVIATNIDNNIETVLTENIDYTVTGVGNDTGGTVVLTEPGLYGYTLTLARNTDLLQKMNLINGGTIDANALEAALDKIVFTLQDLKRQVDNTLRLNRSSLIHGLECEDKVKNDATIVVDPTGTKLRMGMSIAEIIQATLYQVSLGILSVDALSDITPNAGIITAGKLQNVNDTTYFDLDKGELVLEDGLSFKNHLLSIKGTIEITGATGYFNIDDRPTSINDINVSEGIKLAGIQDGADKTSDNPQSVTWLTDAGLLATANSLDDVLDGTQYGKVDKTALSAGKIVLSSLGVIGDLVNSANLCYNSGFTAAYAGWDLDLNTFDPFNITYGVDLNDTWTLKYGHTFWIRQTDCQNDETKKVQFASEQIHVEPNSFYCLSAYTGAYLCKFQIKIGYYDIDNTFLGYGTITHESNINDSEQFGGKSLSNYKRLFIITKVDYPDVAFAKILFIKYDTKAGETESWGFITNVMFSEVTASQVLPVAYQPRGDITAAGTSLDTAHVNGLESTTIIEGGKIGTGLVIADSIAANSITANAVGANQIITQSANIGDLVVDSINLHGHAVTFPVSAYTEGEQYLGTNWTTIQTCTITCSGSMVNLTFFCNLVTSSGAGYQIQILRGTTVIYQTAFLKLDNDSTSFGAGTHDNPGAGDIIYTIQGKGEYIVSTERSLLLMEIKK